MIHIEHNTKEKLTITIDDAECVRLFKRMMRRNQQIPMALAGLPYKSVFGNWTSYEAGQLMALMEIIANELCEG